ncbi:MAG: glycosyltransferase [Pyrinomonadaceae bacterium MAG19_C2-C3]|nr:glycosyltransferase [Pyrinomonadaceae bacterium MAG19_C2-C3]
MQSSTKAGLVLVNGSRTSVQAPRARALFGESARIVYKDFGRISSIKPVWQALKDTEYDWIYCIDLGLPSSVLANFRRRLSSDVRLIYELGDPARPLLANQGRPRWEVAFAHQADCWLPAFADGLVFRGSYLLDYFDKIAVKKIPNSTWIPDGVDCELFRPRCDDAQILALRRAHNLEGKFVVGIVGNIHFNPKVNLFYGWELAEALAMLPNKLPIAGVIVGDGSGRMVVEQTIERLKLGDRLRLVGRVPHAEVATWMNLFDVALSTQTDDAVGWGRTTAKLPEYLACGTPVICSDVGEAHRWLNKSGQTLGYHGMRDENYPQRLSVKLQEMYSQNLLILSHHNRRLALEVFDYKILREQLHKFIAGC